ncbi:class I SAM-dependent methyltransferase [Microvirga pudoricolor]|uniref:class I SAM-dependent methyltransferase n=1 Tax=Microvirga pudoricolor TaxID=2778729 RepID=UPI0019519B83|nr:class I SAM-dependent methyltransferase [Microvirga pudoricolor]MBM6593437.1 class I SAM-dependent methyltransferase [Microvirga pudoricolor]
MERLSFTGSGDYSALEAAIHTARYAIAKPICRGKDILDVACGEGYGAALLKDWGAASVDGVDISDEAIEAAQSNFQREGVRFRTGRAEEVASVFRDRKYNLIISLETFEHLDDPTVYLKQIQSLATDDAVIIISCPNDHWYYPNPDQGNPFHKRKYTFDECRQICEGVLGAGSWRFGGLAIGFTTTPGFSQQGPTMQQIGMMNHQAVEATVMVPPDASTSPDPRFCSYFVGVWGSNDLEPSAAIFPSSMKSLETGPFATPTSLSDKAKIDQLTQDYRRAEMARRALFSDNEILRDAVSRSSAVFTQLSDEIASLHDRNASCQGDIKILRNDIVALNQRLGAADKLVHELKHENELLASSNHMLSHTVDTVPWRVVSAYKAVRRKIPSPALNLVRKLVRTLKAK